jgi:hypothetical protein
MTFEEQFRHVAILQKISSKLMARSSSFSNLYVQVPDHTVHHKQWGTSISSAVRDTSDLGLDIDASPRMYGPNSESSNTLSSFLSQFATSESTQTSPGDPLLLEKENDGLSIEEGESGQRNKVDNTVEDKTSGVNGVSLEKSTEPPKLLRGDSSSGTNEARRQTLANMVSQIRQYDPYPCVLGIPLMPALYSTSKFYVFIFFLLVGLQVMAAAFRRM